MNTLDKPLPFHEQANNFTDDRMMRLVRMAAALHLGATPRDDFEALAAVIGHAPAPRALGLGNRDSEDALVMDDGDHTLHVRRGLRALPEYMSADASPVSALLTVTASADPNDSALFEVRGKVSGGKPVWDSSTLTRVF